MFNFNFSEVSLQSYSILVFSFVILLSVVILSVIIRLSNVIFIFLSDAFSVVYLLSEYNYIADIFLPICLLDVSFSGKAGVSFACVNRFLLFYEESIFCNSSSSLLIFFASDPKTGSED